ncbi:MAG: hypothetical protein ACAI18_18335, partial [Gemmatimonadales bacterium]
MIEGIRREAAWIRPLLVVAALVFAGLGMHWWRTRPAPTPTVNYSTFLNRLDARDVADLAIVPGSEIRGTWRSDRGGFRVVYPTFEVTSLLERAERGGVSVTLDRPPADTGFWRQVALLLVLLGV